MDTLLAQVRASRGLSLATVGAAVRADQGTISRVERGIVVPKRALARALYRFYGGAVPLELIYDARFESDAGG